VIWLGHSGAAMMKMLVCACFLAAMLNAQSVPVPIGSADTSVVPLARSQYDGDWWIFTNVPAHRLYLDGYLDGRGNTDPQVSDQAQKFVNEYYADRSRQRMRVKDAIETFLKNSQPKQSRQRKRTRSDFSGRQH
jgi:hypothetical protein